MGDETATFEIEIGAKVLPRAWAQGFGLELAATPYLQHDGDTMRDDVPHKRQVSGAWAHAGVLDVAEVVEIRRGVRVFTDPEIAGEAPMVEFRIRARSGIEGWTGHGAVVDALAELERAHAMAWESLQSTPGEGALPFAVKRLRWRLEVAEREPKWVVNDNAELGVEVGGRVFFLYKGNSLEYEDGKHDDESPMLYRPVGKREFGETCHPFDYYDKNGRPKHPGRYTVGLVGWVAGEPMPHLEDVPNGGWKPLPPASKGRS